MLKTLIFSITLLTLCLGCAQNAETQSFADEFSKPWHRHKVYTLRLLEAMPDSAYTYKPTDSVRTFAERALHIAGANYGFSTATGGSDFPVEREVLNASGKSKAAILTTVSDSFDYAESVAFKLNNEQLSETVSWSNPIEEKTTRTKREVFHIMREHAAHERGGLTVYLRLKGIEPPSYID